MNTQQQLLERLTGGISQYYLGECEYDTKAIVRDMNAAAREIARLKLLVRVVDKAAS